MKKSGNLLDERQEQKLLQIEHYGCWFAMWALLAAILIQQYVLGFDWKSTIGECVILICLAVYILAACLKNGIWDRKHKPDAKTNLLICVVIGLILGAVMFVIKYVQYRTLAGALASGLIIFFIAVIFGYACCSLYMAAYNRRVRKLEAEDEEDGDEKE